MKVKSLWDATREHRQREWIPRSPSEALKSSSPDARQIKTGHFKSSVSRKRFSAALRFPAVRVANGMALTHIGMQLLCPAIPDIFPHPGEEEEKKEKKQTKKTAAYSASWKP